MLVFFSDLWSCAGFLYLIIIWYYTGLAPYSYSCCWSEFSSTGMLLVVGFVICCLVDSFVGMGWIWVLACLLLACVYAWLICYLLVVYIWLAWFITILSLVWTLCCWPPFLLIILLVYNNLEINNMINLLYKVLFMNWIFKWYFIFLSIIEFMNHSEFMTEITKLHNIEYTLKNY
jgi:hypothetical protein